MFVISNTPSVFLATPAVEDSRLDFDYSNPNYHNAFPHELNISKLGQYLLDATYGTSEKCHEAGLDGDVAVLRMNNIFNAKLKLDDLVYIERINVSNNILRKNDILINRTNSKELVGKCALYEDQIDASYASYLIRLRVDENEILPAFLVLYLTTKHGRNEINKRSCGTANQYNISVGHIKNFDIPCMSIALQKTILERFKKLRDLIALCEAKAQQCLARRFALDQDLDTVFANFDTSVKPLLNAEDWFFGKDRFCRIHNQKRNVAIVKYSCDFDRLDPRYYLPCRLREVATANQKYWGTLSDFAEISRESFVSDGAIEHIAIDQMPDDPWTTFATNEEGYEGPTTYFEEGDICFSRLMPTIMNGKCFMAWGAMTGSPEFIRIRTPKKYKEIFFFWLKTRYVREYLIANVRGSSASQKRFTEDDIAACPVPKNFFESPEEAIEKCVYLLNQANQNANKAEGLRNVATKLIDNIMNNIFELLDLSFVKEVESAVQEALQ